MDMSILLVTVFCALWGPSATLDEKEICYGNSLTFPNYIKSNIQQGPLYFTPRNSGSRKILMENGKANDPRLKVSRFTIRLGDLTKKDEGVYSVTENSKIIDVLLLKISDCAQEIIESYMHEWSFRLPFSTDYVEYTSPHNEYDTLILWNLSNPVTEQRKGEVKDNFWIISGVTQADNGFYNFRRQDGNLRRRVLLTVKENTLSYDSKVNEDLFIRKPWTGGPWTVTFKEITGTKQVTIIENGNLVWDVNRFSGRISIESNGITIRSVEAMDAGTYEFRDPQGNLALSAQVDVDVQVSHHRVTYLIVAVVVVVLGIGCCFCCTRKCCCKKNKSAATERSAENFLKKDKSDSAASSPPMYYHGSSQPTGPGYSIQTSSVYTPRPANSPAYTGTAAVSIEQPPSQPNSAVYPPQPASVYPPQPASVYPPQPASVYPPQPASVHPPQPASVNPPQPEPTPEPSLYPPLAEFGAPASQEFAAAPTFSSDVFSSDAEPRFQLKGLAFPSVSPLSSDAPTCNVYNSDKLNFL